MKKAINLVKTVKQIVLSDFCYYFPPKYQSQLFLVLFSSVDKDKKRVAENILLEKIDAMLSKTIFEKVKQVDMFLELNEANNIDILVNHLNLNLRRLERINVFWKVFEFDLSDLENFRKSNYLIKEASNVVILEPMKVFTTMNTKVDSLVEGFLRCFEKIMFVVDAENCYYCDDVYYYSKKKKIHNFYFIVSDFLFTEEEKFHLEMFFEKLGRDRDFDLLTRLKYKKQSESLLNSSDKECGCLLKFDTILIDYESLNIFYYPRKKVCFDHINDEISAVDSKKETRLQEYRKYLDFSCTIPKTTEVFNYIKNAFSNKLVKERRSSISKKTDVLKIKDSNNIKPQDWEKVLITGWYGTETTGDKAILAEILHFIKQRSPKCQLVLTTLNEKVSKQTERELDFLKNSELVKIEEAYKPKIIEKCDAVIMGGGPLMETNALIDVWRIFKEANRQRKERIIFGCGLGPFNTEEMKKIAAQILQMSTKGFFRDEESFDFAIQLAPDNEFFYACDPAIGFLKRNFAQKNEIEENEIIATLFRANTAEFKGGIDKELVEKQNSQMALKLASMLHKVISESKLKIHFMAMNYHWLGGDDRIFNRLVANNLEENDEVELERRYLTLNGVVESLLNVSAAVAMRYHGHIFCLSLGIPFLSIDYTGQKGKVANLVKRIGYDFFKEDWDKFDEERATKKILDMIQNKKEISKMLIESSDKLYNQLSETYLKMFPL
jgi:polysaccharide pyruvyl transferase WcaK-like protein